MRGGGMPGGDALASPVASASVGVASAGEVLRVGAFVVDLIGDERVRSVVMSSPREVDISVLDPFHAETVARLLGLGGPVDLGAMGENAATGRGGHSYWAGLVRGVRVRVSSQLRLGGLPEPRPFGWKPEDAEVPYVVAKNVRNRPKAAG